LMIVSAVLLDQKKALTISPHPSDKKRNKKNHFTHTNRSNSGDWAFSIQHHNSKREQWTALHR
jgi:hypothetical protein